MLFLAACLLVTLAGLLWFSGLKGTTRDRVAAIHKPTAVSLGIVLGSFVVLAAVVPDWSPVHDYSAFVSRADCAHTAACDGSVGALWLAPGTDRHDSIEIGLYSTSARFEPPSDDAALHGEPDSGPTRDVGPDLVIVGAAQNPVGPVFGPGREGDIITLFSPFVLGEEVAPGWTWRAFSIEFNTVEVGLEDDGGGWVEISMRHTSLADQNDLVTSNFAVSYSCSPDVCPDSAHLMIRALSENDDESYWAIADGSLSTTRLFELPAPSAAIPETTAHGPGDSIGSGTHWLRDGFGFVTRWLGDGFVFTALLLGLLVIVCVRSSQDQRSIAVFSLLALAVVVGAAIRFFMAPDTTLGAWPYSRVSVMTARFWNGPVLLGLGRGGLTVSQGAVSQWVGFTYAVITPIAIFAHGRYLLGTNIAATIAATIFAILPQHIRFSMSEVAFIHSLVLSSALFAVAHMALRDPLRRFRFLAWLAVYPLAAMTVATRPLNVLFLPLILVTIFWLGGKRGQLGHKLVVAAPVVAAFVSYVVSAFFTDYASNIEEGIGWRTIADGFGVLMSLTENIVVNPSITPPLLVVAAAIGMWGGWKSGKTRLVLFLAGWYLVFIFTHAYVRSTLPAMQARYHLHVVVPFVMAAALGLEYVFCRWRRLGMLAAGILAVSPLVHAHFVTDRAFNDMVEYEFVRRMSQTIGDDCRVLEFSSSDAHEVRFAFFANEVGADGSRPRFEVQAIPYSADIEETHEVFLEALDSSPSCVYLSLGLPCWGEDGWGDSIAPVCEMLATAAPFEQVASESFKNRRYDLNVAPRIVDPEVELSIQLYRLRSPDAGLRR